MEDNSDFCLPNRCYCENGLAATSSYGTMRTVCGVRQQDEQGIDSDSLLDPGAQGSKTRIYNGDVATQNDFPFQCQLYKTRQTNTIPLCSASILSPLFLLTAGHCLVEEAQTLATVYALVESETGGLVPSTQIHVHENYYESVDQSGFLLNDIGLVYLSKPVLFDASFRPICIHDTSMQDMFDNEEGLIVAGYGGGDTLKKAIFNVKDDSECESQSDNQMEATVMTFDNGTVILDTWQNKFCAGSISSEQAATCAGDSGAPLMIELNELILGKLTVKYGLVGIVSVGAKVCSNDQLPTIFTDVHSYSDWIANKIDETEYTNAGRYCTVDNDQQCASCDSAFKLNGFRCEQEFTQNQMNSLYSFFNNTFCAEDCVNYMGVVLKDDAKNFTVCEAVGQEIHSDEFDFKAKYHICRCEYGLPALRCENEVEQFCDPDHCHINYKYNFGKKSCIPNVCKCEHGEAATLCADEDKDGCDPEGCDDGYGFVKASNSCEKIDKSLLCSKVEHYVNVTETCEPNVCYCAYGHRVGR